LRKAAEEAAYRAKAEAEAASQAKSRFLATISHELRTPLNAILGYAQVLQIEATLAGMQTILPHLERIGVAGRHLMSVINNVLDFSKIEAGKMELDLAVIDVRRIADESIAIIAPLADERSNRLELICDPGVGTIWSDPGKLRQILFNLLANAAKFTEHGTITLRVTRDADVGAQSEKNHPIQRESGWVCFRISDTGIGMTPEQQQRLFQPFVQADAAITRSYGGTGLGLALSRQLCELLEGQISMESELGQGTTFTVRLPVSPASPMVVEDQQHLGATIITA
jgi:signal transduction histidine kinase